VIDRGHDLPTVQAALRTLGEHARGPFVVRLPRAAGARDARYVHLMSGSIDGATPPCRPGGRGRARGSPAIGAG